MPKKSSVFMKDKKGVWCSFVYFSCVSFAQVIWGRLICQLNQKFKSRYKNNDFNHGCLKLFQYLWVEEVFLGVKIFNFNKVLSCNELCVISNGGGVKAVENTLQGGV